MTECGASGPLLSAQAAAAATEAAAASASDVWRASKVAFVSGHSGAPPLDVALVLCVLAGLAVSVRGVQSRALAAVWIAAVLVLAHCVSVEAALTLSTGAGVCRAVVLARHDTEAGERARARRLVSVTEFRAIMMAATCFCILAVDFTVFPRSMAKTEAFGVSLMDFGVGAVAFAVGLVAKNERVQPARLLFVVALGVVRLVTVKAMGYPEHETEYGVHWNFFFTIAVLQLLSSVCAAHDVAALAGTLALLVAYQAQLASPSFVVAMLHGPRDTLLMANREGVASLITHSTIMAFAVVVRRRALSAPGAQHVLRTLGALGACVAVLGASLLLQEQSRRLGNLPYVAWVCTMSTLLLFVLDNIASEGSRRAKASAVLDDVNTYMLATFLVANLLTGLVNVSVDSISVAPGAARVLLTAYLVVVLLSPHLISAALQILARAQSAPGLVISRVRVNVVKRRVRRAPSSGWRGRGCRALARTTATGALHAAPAVSGLGELRAWRRLTRG